MPAIRLNHEQVIREAARLGNIATDLQHAQTTVRNVLNEMSSYWEGAAANSFTAANAEWQRETSLIESEINDLAVQIKRIADDIQAAEARAAIASG
ncbi:MAG: WXG100 family type VII secretion target [Clostridiales bacterium]|jgi:WXG100 family type VII secretion target|nr:WXG100 family type VII secretion target [Clostridiales bacterium]